MFSRNPERANEEPRRSPALPGTGLRETAPVSMPSIPPPTQAADESLIAREDTFDGKLKTTRGVRIAGTLSGNIESSQYVHIEENAKVSADIGAEEVIISGQYTGKLVCRQRLEIRATGRVSGEIETVKLMLHEGGYFDGELHMQKPGGDGQGRVDAADPRGSRRPEVTPTAGGSRPASPGGSAGASSAAGSLAGESSSAGAATGAGSSGGSDATRGSGSSVGGGTSAG